MLQRQKKKWGYGLHEQAEMDATPTKVLASSVRQAAIRARRATTILHTPFRCFYQKFVGHAAAFFYNAQSSAQFPFHVVFRSFGL
jgi:hypothetical protein